MDYFLLHHRPEESRAEASFARRLPWGLAEEQLACRDGQGCWIRTQNLVPHLKAGSLAASTCLRAQIALCIILGTVFTVVGRLERLLLRAPVESADVA